MECLKTLRLSVLSEAGVRFMACPSHVMISLLRYGDSRVANEHRPYDSRDAFVDLRARKGCVTLLAVATAIAAYCMVVRIRMGFMIRDHDVIFPMFLVAPFGTFTSPFIGGLIGALSGERLEPYEYHRLVALGVLLGFGLSVICFGIASHIAFEYLA